MRTVAIAVGVLLPLACWAPTSWALSSCPGITTNENGDIGVHLESLGSCTGSTCSPGLGSLLEEIAAPLCNALPLVEGECGRCDCCRDLTFDLFTGTDLQLVGPDPTKFCKIGNRGQPMGEAALCLLRDLAAPARSPSLGGPGIHLERGGSLGVVGPVSIAQHIGFVDFNLAARRMRGFHAVSVCAPVLGCIQNQVQPFTATLQQVVGPVGTCGDYQFRTPWILHVETEELVQNVGLRLPPVPIVTPVGEFKVQPFFGYELNLEAVTSPWAADNHGTLRDTPLGGCVFPRLRDVVDANGGVFASSVAVLPTSTSDGWDARLGLGTRDPDPKGQVWVPPPNNEFPDRPDDDFSMARKDTEKQPTARLHTGIEVTYPIANLVPKLNKPPLHLLTAEAFVNSALDAAFVSQFALGVDEGKPGPAGGDCTPPAETRVMLQSAIDAQASIDVTIGLRIEVELNLLFTTKTFRFNPKVTPPPVVKVDFASPMLGPNASAAMMPAASPPSLASYNSFISFSAGGENGDAFVDACLVQPPPPPQTIPTPVTEPGDPLDLIRPQEFPCNICLFFPSMVTQACLPRPELVAAGIIPADYDECDLAINGMPCTDPNCSNQPISPPVPVDLKDVIFPVSQAGFPASERWMCDAFEKFGCYDLCRYDPSAADPLTITQSAVVTSGPRCRDATGGSDPSPEGQLCTSTTDPNCNDGNPCTNDLCTTEGEFLVCRITQSQGSCDDHLFCNGTDTCALGICGAHAGNPCAAAGACCDEQSDTCPASCPRTPCEGKNAADPCDDGSACTLDDHCDPTSGFLICRGAAALSCPDTTCIAGICADVAGTAMCVDVPSGFCPPECGDGGLDAGEECDGTSDSACPGECQPDCSCPPPGRMTGEPCTTPSQCASGICARGVCCGSACNGAGERCDLPGQAGTCVTVAAPVPALSATALLVGLGILLLIAHTAVRRSKD